MGTWGPKLYEDDLAEDIKDEYERLIEEGKTNEETIKYICKAYKEEIEDEDERPIFWMVLADILCRKKRLTKFAKEKALEEIEVGKNLEKWKRESSEKEYIIRKKEIEKLKNKLEKYNEEEVKETPKVRNKTEIKSYKNEWEIGDTYAYKIESKKYEGQYLIFRKVQNCKYYNNTRYQSAIVYVQITSNKEIPKNEHEINGLDYIIVGNQGNVKYEYKIQLYQIPRKQIDELIYLGNFKNIKAPNDEYIEKEEINMHLQSVKNMEYIITKIIDFGTNKKPIYIYLNFICRLLVGCLSRTPL